MTATPSRASLPELIDVEEFFADPQFAVPSISQDGTRIAYLAPKYGRRNVWEDEGHGFENPENQFRLYRATERHFAEHLGGRRDTSSPKEPGKGS
jgi:hypothetical protein